MMERKNRIYTNLHAESGDASLSNLESKLRNAYVLKSLEAQVAEKKAQRMSEDLEERIVVDLMNTSILSSREEKRQIQKQQLQQTQTYKRDLEKQISEKRIKEEYTKHKEELERSVLIEVDRARELEEQINKAWTKVTLADRLERQSLVHREMKEVIRHRELDLEIQEQQKIQRHLLEVDARNANIESMKRERILQRQAAIDSLARTMLDQNSERKERRELLTEILAEEMRQEALVRATEERLRRKRMANELATGLKEQMKLEEEFRKAFAEKEAKFAEDAMMELMKSEFIQRKTDEARRRMQMEFRQELEKLMKEREKKREEEQEIFWEFLEIERQEEMDRRKKVQDERMKLLQEHSANVGEFVDTSALTKEEEEIVSARVGG